MGFFFSIVNNNKDTMKKLQRQAICSGRKYLQYTYLIRD